MLSHRILTALILIPLVVAAVLWLATWQLAFLLAPLLVMAGYEWASLGGLVSPLHRSLYAASLLLLLALGLWLPAGWSGFPWLGGLALAGWLVITVRLATLREVRVQPGVAAGKLLVGLLVMAATWGALLWLHRQTDRGAQLLLFLMALIWVADSLAYFAGRRWGQARLAPHISPGKTRAGLYGALVGGLLWAAAFAGYFAPQQRLQWVSLCLAVVVLSVAGDLFESLLKRQAGVKDSGQLLPGHGGVLDRIDSLTAALPAFALGCWLLGIVGP